ncbi:hypothetical protein [Synechocystis sp. PCC 7509]|uniref:hypothetical protein n=1 Tax=Synechocystis sp. PCC 7509 TaxID=927677 RepID=UPI0002AC55E8|nr:hypothetical protein [Synechocystis sp. PCC 7509]
MGFQFKQNFSQLIGASVASLLCTGAIVALQLPQLTKLNNKAKTASVADFQKQVESEKLQLQLLRKIPSLGFDRAIADWTFINFLLYFGDDDAREKTGYSLSPEYFEVIIDRDPYFLRSYLFLSSSTTLYAGMPERSVALMNRGLKSLSPQIPAKSYYVWRYKAIDELLFLGDAKAAKNSYTKAAEWASTYSDDESKYVALFSRQTAAFLAANPNSKIAQITSWTSVLGNAFDDRTRRRAISQIQKLGGIVTVTPEGKLNVQLSKQVSD